MKKNVKQTTILWFFFFVIVGAVVFFANFRFNMYGDALFLDHRSIEPAPKAETILFWHNLYRWDAGWYANIVQYGYTLENITFFPLYPLLIRIVMYIWQGSDHAFYNTTFLVALLSVWYSIYALLRLSHAETKRENDLFPAIFFLFFPTAFFLAAPYTEGLFIAFLLGALLMIREGKFVYAGIFSFFLALTRVTGVCFIFFPLYLFFFSSQKKNMRTLIPAITSIVGFGLFLVYQKVKFDSFLAFLDAQQGWGRDVSFRLWAFVERYYGELSNMMRLSLYDAEFWVYATNILFTVLGIFAIVFLFRYGKKEYAVLSAAFLLVPLLTATMYSMPRLVLPIVPLVALFLGEHVRNEHARYLIIITCTFLWVLFLVAFTRGYWVA